METVSVRGRPIIGITAGFENESLFLRRKYCDCICQAGGEAVIITPALKEFPHFCQGILLSGGGDVLPGFYGGSVSEDILFEPSEERDIFELMLANKAFGSGVPVFAICRGIQVLNVALGGGLCGDIENHRQTLPREEPSHIISMAKGSLVRNLAGSDKAYVNSFHHQAIDRIADALRVSAVCDDGTIEAVEGTGRGFCLGVQWHPEHMFDSSPFARRLFESFVEAAMGNSSDKRRNRQTGINGKAG